jgi:hypothetical protein
MNESRAHYTKWQIQRLYVVIISFTWSLTGGKTNLWWQKSGKRISNGGLNELVGHLKLSMVVRMSYNLNNVLIKLEDAFIKTHQTIYLRYTQFTIGKF